MKTIYRVSDCGYPKNKLPSVNNDNCFINFCVNFLARNLSDLILIQDNCSSSTISKFSNIIKNVNLGGNPILIETSRGNAGSYKYALDYAIKNFEDGEIVYMVEGDYIHDVNSKSILQEGFSLIGAEIDYVTLYAHPDKEFAERIQPEYIFRSASSYWRSSDSTTMTLSAKVKTLKEDYDIINKWIDGAHPDDHQMFLELRKKNRILVNPIPGYSTHGEKDWLSPHKDWNLILANSIL